MWTTTGVRFIIKLRILVPFFFIHLWSMMILGTIIITIFCNTHQIAFYQHSKDPKQTFDFMQAVYDQNDVVTTSATMDVNSYDMIRYDHFTMGFKISIVMRLRTL